MDEDTREYFRQRERRERAAAKKAASPEARRVHQQLAQNYAELMRQEGEAGRVNGAPGRSRLTIVT